MAVTVGDIRTDIRALGFETDTAAQQLVAINGAMRRIMSGPVKWDWALASTTITTAVGDFDYAMPAGVGSPSSLRLVTAGSAGDELVHVPRERLQQEIAASAAPLVTGVPAYWTDDSSFIYVWPIPNAVSTLTLRYFRAHTTLTADGDALLIPDDYRDVVTFCAAARISQRERDWAAASAFEREYKDRLAEMKKAYATTDKQTAGRVVQSGYYGADWRDYRGQ